MENQVGAEESWGRLKDLLEDLTGQKAPLSPQGPPHGFRSFGSGKAALGLSQFNELLLLLGYDRVAPAFFQFLVDRSTEYGPGAGIRSLGHLEAAVELFRKIALIHFGNVKYAFKILSSSAQSLEYWLSPLEQLGTDPFTSRHDPLVPIESIRGEEAYYLGYIVASELESKLASNPNDSILIEESKKRERIVEVGMRNHEAYLASDHLDVYVATSMRERHEYLMVHELTEAIFSSERLKDLKLRWFDPTQAFCLDRIDKGLSEALMLKRAKCTIYLAQESDTLGKDSELASTLAQGKPVIAYVPPGDGSYVASLLSRLKEAYPSREERQLILEQLQVFSPGAAWENSEVRAWLESPESIDVQRAREFLMDAVARHYSKRAATLKEQHPLGIQVNLETGVANGVLVVRSVDDCAELIYRVLTRSMEFDLEEKEVKGKWYVLLRERVSQSVFRVMTGDPMLTNTFWNFYPELSEGAT